MSLIAPYSLFPFMRFALGLLSSPSPLHAMGYALCASDPVKDSLELFNELGEGSRCKGEEKGQKHHSANHFPFQIEGRFVI